MKISGSEKRSAALGKRKLVWERMKPGIFVSLAVSFMICIFAPLEIYLSNSGEFWYDAYLLFPFCLGSFAVLMLAGALVFFLAGLMGERVYHVVLAVSFSAFAGLYAQGNFGTGNLPPFDGTEVNWAAYGREIAVSTVCWLVIAAVVFALLGILRAEKFRRMVSGVCLFVFAMLFCTLAVLGISGGIFQQKQFVKFTKNDQFEMSKEQNFIILLLDAIDEECFWQMWERHPEYREGMADFTFYDNTLTGYPYTRHALPLLLSGEWYENGEPFEDYERRIYQSAPLFERLRDEGYSLSFYDDELQFEVGELDGAFENMSLAKSTLWDPVLFWKRQIKMVGVKYAPWLFKRFCWFDPAKLRHQQMPAKGEELFVWGNREFYDDVKGKEITYTEGRRFKLIHLIGAHVPFYYDQYVNEVDDADYFSCIESSMTVTLAYLDKLREAGVYDNSVILVMSDHGYNISGDAVRIPQRFEDATQRQHPILFVKGLGERHELRISGAPVAFEDMVEACGKLLAGSQSDDIFDYREGDYRERRYILYEYLNEEHMVEYIQTGYAGDEDTMRPTGRVYDYR